MVYGRYLVVQCPQVIQVTQAEHTGCQQVNDAGEPFAQVHPVNTEQPQKSQQAPGQGIIDMPYAEFQVGLLVHGWYQEKIDQPPDAQQAQGKKPDGAGNWFSIVEAVGSGESEYPQNVAHGFQMGVVGWVHICKSKIGLS